MLTLRYTKKEKFMNTKIFILCLMLTPSLTNSYYDMTMDRPYTTDIPLQITDNYYTARNPTRAAENVPARKNRWARCNENALKVKEYCQDEEIV